MKQIVINFFGGPGSGKSTQAAKVFAGLKEAGINAELITEYAKDLTWQESFHVMKNQLYLFAKQQHRLWRVSDKVQVIITDAPLLLSLVYGENCSISFKQLVKEEFDKYQNYNVFLQRPHSYQKEGRYQTEEEAKEIDDKIRTTLKENNYMFNIDIPVHESLAKIIVEQVLRML